MKTNVIMNVSATDVLDTPLTHLHSITGSVTFSIISATGRPVFVSTTK